MKPLKISFQCFGPYRKQQCVDFTKLDKLFLIAGETGAGKTTILDAISYALYCESSNGARGGLISMRTKNADRNDITEIVFDFESGEETYRFVRRLVQKVKNIQDEHACYIKKDGNFIPLLENPKQSNVTQEAVRIIGLNAEQFRQVVLLPQGKFENFLTSDSAEKEGTLVSIFHADRWQRIADRVMQNVQDETRRLDDEKSRIETIFSSFEVKDRDGLAEKLAESETEEERLGKELKQAQKAEKEQQERNRILYELKNAFVQYRTRKDTLDGILAKQKEMELLKNALIESTKTEKLMPAYAKLEEVKEEEKRKTDAVSKAEKEYSEAQELLETAEKKKETHDSQKGTQEKKKKLLASYESGRENYSRMEENAEKLEKARGKQADAEERCSDAGNRKKEAQKKLLDAQEIQRNEIENYLKAQKVFRSNLLGNLSKGLEKGVPCPVCGSIEHPSPYVFSEDGENISAAELEELNQKQMEAGETEKACSEDYTLKDGNYEKEKENLESCKRDLAALEAVMEELKNQSFEGIVDLADLDAHIESLREETEKFEQEEMEIRNQVQYAGTCRSEKSALKQRAEEEKGEWTEKLAKARNAFLDGLEKSGIADEETFLNLRMTDDEKQEKQNLYSEYLGERKSAEEEEKQQREKIDGKEEPDTGKAEAELKALEEKREKLFRDHTIQKEKTVRMKEILEKLKPDIERYELDRRKNEENLEFAKRLRGDRGIGLQRYVLGVMLTLVTIEANKLLETVYGGRYRLYRSDESAGSARKKGLELEVLDFDNKERRSVRTLSGGEKFIVALSLALGLSMVVQANGNGIRMEALFVDEGFGTLDHSTLNDAISVLERVQGKDGMVGIISHVDRLLGTIPSKLLAEKTEKGSILKLPY